MRFAKIDANQSEIVKELRKVGAFVQSLATIGKGCPDLLVGYRGNWFLMEVKDAKKAQSQRELTQDEMDWILRAAKSGPVHIVETVAQALGVLGVGEKG
jgi:Holliday junction resolvase